MNLNFLQKQRWHFAKKHRFWQNPRHVVARHTCVWRAHFQYEKALMVLWLLWDTTTRIFFNELYWREGGSRRNAA